MGLFFHPRCTDGRTGFTRETARRAADEASPLVTYAIAERVPAKGRAPERWYVHLWNWQTRRAANVHYTEHLDAAVEYVGIIDPKQPKYPPPRRDWWC